MKECPHCRGSVSKGFVIDRGDATRKVQKWVEGEPVRSFWLGLNTEGRDAYEVTTYRCDRCGYLESYAKTPAETGWSWHGT